MSIESGLPTTRTADSGIGLGAPQDQVLAAYAGNLDDRSHPFVSAGHILRADAGNGTGIAFLTDGTTVIGVVRGRDGRHPLHQRVRLNFVVAGLVRPTADRP